MQILKHVFLVFISFVFAFPFLWMILGSFKTNNEIWQKPYQILPEQWDLSKIQQGLSHIHMEVYLTNSLFVAVVGTLALLLAAALFTYASVFMRSRQTDILFAVVLATYMLPGAVTYVPSYVILSRINLLDTLPGLIFSNLASVFSVFYLRQSFKKMSYDYFEAAIIDGAHHLQILRYVVFPLNQSAFVTLFLLNFIQQYNNYMWPSIMLKTQNKYLISQGLRQFFIQGGAYGMNWSEVMLASTVAIIPLCIFFILCRKKLVTGIMQESGLK